MQQLKTIRHQTDMMNLTIFAPEDFKEHLRLLDNKAKFLNARLRCELGTTSNHQHYVITGNEGVGKGDAVDEIYQRIAGVTGIVSHVTKDATSMFDANGGFENTLREACQSNTLLHIRNAEELGKRGYVNPNSGIEDLCNIISEINNSIVVLSGKRAPLLEAVNGHEDAKHLFSYIFNFEDLTPEAMCR